MTPAALVLVGGLVLAYVALIRSTAARGRRDPLPVDPAEPRTPLRDARRGELGEQLPDWLGEPDLPDLPDLPDTGGGADGGE